MSGLLKAKKFVGNGHDMFRHAIERKIRIALLLAAYHPNERRFAHPIESDNANLVTSTKLVAEVFQHDFVTEFQRHNATRLRSPPERLDRGLSCKCRTLKRVATSSALVSTSHWLPFCIDGLFDIQMILLYWKCHHWPLL